MEGPTARNPETIQADLHHVSPQSFVRKPSRGTYNFSAKEIFSYLYSHSELKHVNTGKQSGFPFPATKKTIENCSSCDDLPNDVLCTKHKHLETLRILRSPGNKDQQSSRAISSFPPEVELCTSSVPGKCYGVRTVRTIPEGTWIGPYEGKHVKPEDITAETETSYMWEIFQDGKLAYYLDGSDENNSSWMRYIRCARYKGEQNTSVMQYFGNIYYRVFKEILPGNEILVWYDDTCPHHLGIPLKMQDIGTTTTSRENTVTKAPVPSRVTLNSPTTGNPPLQNVPPRPVMPTFVPHHGYTPLQPVVRAPPLPRYQAAFPMISRDTLLHSSFPNSSNYNLRELNDAYTAAAIYGSRTSFASGKSKSASTIISHKNIHDTLVSHAVLPYPPCDPPMIQSKTNGILDQSRTSPQLSPIQSSSSTGSRDAPHTGSNSPKVKLDQNGNIKTTGMRTIYSEKITNKQSGMTSSDNTINKFLSQIEEARIEEMKEKQRSLKEQKKETNSSQESEDSFELSIWKCGQCGKAFAQQQILQLHICSSIPEKPYKCTYCPEAFAQPSDLRTHAVIHSGKKPFKCGFCSRLFAGSTTLNNHIRTHTGERPFGCEKCGKDFSQASQLSRHRRGLFECK